MSVGQRFEGRGVLITGTTGFLGKVLLEKILFSLSGVGKVWVLIRGKLGFDAQARFRKEVVGSVCFDRLRARHRTRFDQFIQEKVQPIQGDLQKEGLGLAPEVLNDLLTNCHIVINCAASVDFNARLDHAIDSNIRGSLRMLELARKMRNLCVFTHISTCYVNCDQRGKIPQIIADKPISADEELNSLEKMPLAQLITETRRILGSYPNTYTFTKSLCERVMKARQGTVPLCIVRPAIINTAYAEPCPGWIDSLAAAAALFLLVGLGILQEAKGDPNLIGDTIPVDIVVSNIIVASAYNFNNLSLPIYHVGSSDRNPMTWGEINEQGSAYWDTQTTQYQVSTTKFLITDKQWLLDIRRWKRSAMLEIYRRVGPLFDKNASKNAQKVQKAVARGHEVGKLFEYFMTNQWIFENRNLKGLMDFLTPAERSEYLIDIAEINFRKYIQINGHGLLKYILKENINPKADNLLNVGADTYLFSELRWALQIKLSPTQCKTRLMSFKVLESAQVQKEIAADSLRRMQEGMEEGMARSAAEDQARKAVEELGCELKPGAVQAMAWAIRKVFKNIFEQVSVNKQILEELRKVEQAGGPIVLLPTRRSYLDFLVVSYVFIIFKMRLPHFVADASLLQTSVLPLLVHSSGAFFFRPLLYSKSALYRAVFNKYLDLMLQQDGTLGMYLEEHRSRTGKAGPMQAQLLSTVIDNILYNKDSEVCLVPITVNYEKIPEEDTLHADLLGEKRAPESFMRFLKASLAKRSNYGRVLVKICKPLMAREFANDFSSRLSSSEHQGPQFRRKLGEALAFEVARRQVGGIVVMSTAIVSSILLMHRKGVNEDDLVVSVSEVARQLMRKGFKVDKLSENSALATINSTVGFLKGLAKSKRGVFELTVNDTDGLKNALMLSYYRNTLLQAFLPDAFLACALASFSRDTRQGVLLSRLHAQTLFLVRLLRNDHFLQQPIESPQEFAVLVQRMHEEQLLQLDGQKVSAPPSAMRLLNFYCSLLQAPIECCLASLAYVISVAESIQRRQQVSSIAKLFDRVQWLMESMYRQQTIQCLEACSVESIKAVFTVFEQDCLIRITTISKRLVLVEVLVKTEQLEALQNNFSLFRNSSYSLTRSPLQTNKSAHFPKL